MTSPCGTRVVFACALMLASTGDPAAAQAAISCAGQTTACAEVPGFVATITGFRPDASGGAAGRMSATIRFANKTPRQLVIGYVEGSGIATDDRGNRYVVRSGSVAGIGTIGANSFDPKSAMEPGGSATGTLGFDLSGQSDATVSAWSVELTVREIDPVANNQYKLGKEHRLVFRGLKP